MQWLNLSMVLASDIIGTLPLLDILRASCSFRSLSFFASFHFADNFGILVAKQQIDILSIARTGSMSSVALCASFRSGIALLHVSENHRKLSYCEAYLPSSLVFGMRSIHAMACRSCNCDLSMIMCATFSALTTPFHFPRVHCATWIVEAKPHQA